MQNEDEEIWEQEVKTMKDSQQDYKKEPPIITLKKIPEQKEEIESILVSDDKEKELDP